MNVFALKIHIGMEIGARMQDVLEDKNGMEKNVLVQEDLTSMELSVYNVLMDKFGMKGQKFAFVREDIDGMETTAKKFTSVLEEESTTKHSSSVFVQKAISGTDLRVWFNLNAAVEKDGTKKSYSVNALKVLIGMASSVFNV